MSLENKVAIVTGAAQGIGFAVAKRFVSDGAKVVIADIDDAKGEEAVEDLQTIGEAMYIHCNVAERLDVRNMVAETLNAYGDIDILVNNAGIVIGSDFLELEEADFDRVLSTNLKGAFLCSQAVARHMVEKIEGGGEPGCIINMSSVNSVLAIPNQIPYCVSKGGVSQLTKSTALALAPHGIRVNAIGPGSIMTEMLAAVNSDREARQRLMSRTPLLRIGEPAEIAGVAAFLASQDAGYITGQTIFADGGRMPLNYTVAVPDGD
ncbi:MAG: 3-oxoacyl-ACP reductase family protein [Roseibium album]|uniref:SDR family NAD(P)-dependent oxidoreductase n=1 Tax=Roseibium album TaxID=311410 RepID=UPI000D54C1DC|nr:NAD(P)-dependent dehydrogenase (short-subunit alcohol dehydrogenase family) [Labrenzia sp. EL_132]MBG6204471.1 NAD(P)-dependent dehydrogenase (short-subunit alcohol dehydrogenase family) [Labrenzia sp. EL_13]MBG6230412.1 NAD(P)-dependent dehydrogenase (short-subunit alcohol dehydrogenase family) [Labrenzia sp. EL_208]MCR9059415.1 3-oxoacyl-ACP reductase FabG [Paracoccaceae bacterium]